MNRSVRLSGGDTVMKLQMRLPFRPLLLAAITSCSMLAAASTAVSGIEYLTSLGIRLICDVRSDSERARAPDHWVGITPEFLAVPIGSNLITSPTAEDLKRRIAAINGQANDSVRAYEYATKYAGQYAKILQRLASGDLPAVEHCTAGKDRTGVFSAILLTALGVPREVVIQDYLLSNQYLLAPDTIQNTAADLRLAFGLPEPPDLATVKSIITSKPETLAAAL